MKRRIFKFVLFLLLGAIINVAVAWGCGLQRCTHSSDVSGIVVQRYWESIPCEICTECGSRSMSESSWRVVPIVHTYDPPNTAFCAKGLRVPVGHRVPCLAQYACCPQMRQAIVHGKQVIGTTISSHSCPLSLSGRASQSTQSSTPRSLRRGGCSSPRRLNSGATVASSPAYVQRARIRSDQAKFAPSAAQQFPPP